MNNYSWKKLYNLEHVFAAKECDQQRLNLSVPKDTIKNWKNPKSLGNFKETRKNLTFFL